MPKNYKLSVHDVLKQVDIITEYLEDMSIAFISDLTHDNFAEMELITELNSMEVMEVLSYLFKLEA